MGINTKVLASVVPLHYDGKTFRFAVALTPRLPDTGTLREYPEVLNWDQYLPLFNKNININFASGTVLKVVIKAKMPGNGSLAENNWPESSLWRKMFHQATPVNGWVINELPYTLADNITRTKMRDEIRKGINDAIGQLLAGAGFGDDDPFTYDGNEIRRRREMASFANYLESLKSKDIVLILNDPLLSDNRFSPVLQNLFKRLENIYKIARDTFNDLSTRLTVAEIEKRNYEEIEEFHKRFSAYANHPYLLWQTGWILEYETDDLKDIEVGKDWMVSVDKETFLNNAVATSNAAYASFCHEVEFIQPHTMVNLPAIDVNDLVKDRYVLSSPAFFNVNRAAFLQLSEETGYVKLRSSVYEIKPELVDKTQLMTRVESLLKKNFDYLNQNVTPVTRNRKKLLQMETVQFENDAKKGTGGHEYITSGISMEIKNLRKMMEQDISHDPSNVSQEEFNARQLIEGSGIIYRHNLVAGYRVDAVGLAPHDQTTFKMGTLCARMESFFTATNPAAVTTAKIPSGNFLDFSNGITKSWEGSIMESAQGSNSGRLYVDEEIFRFNNASLISGAIGKHSGIDATKEQGSFNINVKPAPKSLVPLRFGHKYSFALRPVDITGQGQFPVGVNQSFTKNVLLRYMN